MYEDWAMIPLDVAAPPVDMHALKQLLQSKCDGCYFQNGRVRFTLFHARKPVVDGRVLLHSCDPRFVFNVPGAQYDWDPAFAAQFPELVAWFEQFPFTTLEVVSFLVQTAEVPVHLDLFGGASAVQTYEQYRQLEPMYYRVLFTEPSDQDSRTASLYVLKHPHDARRYVQLPEGVTAFALAATTCYHAADYNPGRFKATAAVSGTLDHQRHTQLLGRSLERYSAHAIRLAEPGPVSDAGARAVYE